MEGNTSLKLDSEAHPEPSQTSKIELLQKAST